MVKMFIFFWILYFKNSCWPDLTELMAYLPTVDKNAKYSNGQHIAAKDMRKYLILQFQYAIKNAYLPQLWLLITHYKCIIISIRDWPRIWLQMERYIRTQSSPPTSPVTPHTQTRPAAPVQSPLTSHHQQLPRPQPLPHQQVGGNLKKGSSTSSLDKDRVITQAKVGGVSRLNDKLDCRWWRSSLKDPTALWTICGTAWPLLTIPGEAPLLESTVFLSLRTTSSWAGPTWQVTPVLGHQTTRPGTLQSAGRPPAWLKQTIGTTQTICQRLRLEGLVLSTPSTT